MNVIGRIHRRPFDRAVPIALVAAWCATPSVHAQADIPKPAKGHWAQTTLALLQHSHDQCSSVGKRASTYWRQLSGGDAEAALDRYMLTNVTADLMGARKARDIARGFLEGAKAEIDAVESKILDHLYAAETDFCDAVAQPEPPRADYESRIAEAEAKVETARNRLGVILLLTEDPRELAKELSKELEPYLDAIELAAELAKEQVLQELESQKPPPKLPTPQELMEDWHAGYQQAVAAAKTALHQYIESRRQNDSSALQTACKDLQDAVNPLLVEDLQVFRAPDGAVEKPLKAVYTAMRRIGTRCSAGQFKKADEAYAWMQEQLNRAAVVLAPYSLRP